MSNRRGSSRRPASASEASPPRDEKRRRNRLQFRHLDPASATANYTIRRHVRVQMESSSPTVSFPLLLTPIETNYRACTIPYQFETDNPRKATPVEIQWIDLFLNSVPFFKQRAETDPIVPDALRNLHRGGLNVEGEFDNCNFGVDCAILPLPVRAQLDLFLPVPPYQTGFSEPPVPIILNVTASPLVQKPITDLNQNTKPQSDLWEDPLMFLFIKAGLEKKLLDFRTLQALQGSDSLRMERSSSSCQSTSEGSKNEIKTQRNRAYYA